MITYELTDNKVLMFRDGIELGFIEYSVEEAVVDIENVYIYPGMRKNGYGKMLCDRAIELIKERELGLISNCWFITELYR